MSQQALREKGDFLKFTLSQLGQPFSPFSFAVTPSITETIKVEVLAEGIILFTPDIQYPLSVCDTDKQDSELPKILLSCGIHGDETAPIEMCQKWIQDIILGRLPIKVQILFILGNLDAIKVQKRFISNNLNTLFSGQHGLTYTAQSLQNERSEKARACLIEHWVDIFLRDKAGVNQSQYQNKKYQALHLDLHTAIRGSKYEKFAISPYLQGRIPKVAEREFLTLCGLECLLMAHAPTKAFTYFTSNVYKAISYTLELGKVMPWGENNLANSADFIKEVEYLLLGKVAFLLNAENTSYQTKLPLLPLFKMKREIVRQAEEFTFNFSQDVDNFTVFPVGYTLAQNDKEAVRVEHPEEAILFPNANVAIGQRALLTVVPLK